jgi:hypothetical protein
VAHLVPCVEVDKEQFRIGDFGRLPPFEGGTDHPGRGQLSPVLADCDPFIDVVKVWQQDAVAWMFNNMITTGTSPTEFSPDDPVTRGQLAAFFYRYKGSPPVVVDVRSPLCGGRDEFDGGLQAGWTWAGGDPALRSFTMRPGYLSMTAVLMTPPVDSQILLRDPVADEYEIETRLSTAPVAEFGGGGLTVRADGDDKHQISLLRTYTNSEGDGIYLDNVTDGNGGPVDVSRIGLPQGTGDVYLRIRYEAGVYTGSYSLDGISWTEVGSRVRVLSNPLVGIQNGGFRAPPVINPTIEFDWFAERAI